MAREFDLPWFRFDVADYLTDERVALLDLPQEGALLRLRCYFWRQGSLPSDPSVLARLCNASIDEFEKKIWPDLAAFFEERDDGRLVDSELDRERRRVFRRRAAKSKGGTKGAQARWGKDKNGTPNGSAMGTARAREIEAEEETEEEEGQEGAEGSSFLRSSDPSGEASGKQFQGNFGKRNATTLSREDLLERGHQAVAARFAPLLREHLYAHDGRPPKGYSEGRDVGILHELLRDGYPPEHLELALRGLAHERDAGQLDVARPGQAVTARILRSDVAGLRDPVVHFEDVGRRLQAGELDPDQSRSSSEEGLLSVGELLNPAGTNGDLPAAGEDV